MIALKPSFRLVAIIEMQSSLFEPNNAFPCLFGLGFPKNLVFGLGYWFGIGLGFPDKFDFRFGDVFGEEGEDFETWLG